MHPSAGAGVGILSYQFDHERTELVDQVFARLGHERQELASQLGSVQDDPLLTKHTLYDHYTGHPISKISPLKGLAHTWPKIVECLWTQRITLLNK